MEWEKAMAKKLISFLLDILKYLELKGVILNYKSSLKHQYISQDIIESLQQWQAFLASQALWAF